MFENPLQGHYLTVVGTEEKGSSEEEVQWDDTMLHKQYQGLNPLLYSSNRGL